ncbi:MAG: cell division protein [Zymomonas mobilis]|uniref:Cell division transport system permease protein n=1 Tax=Zymomonas mobilis TaxID=542 RepID=A0A542W023_ZYMMB|nr:cell division protein [Zymomonas mobilis]TQL16907.1 cell division transport system permease protein [Zymomonas mobilis]
MKKPQLFTFPDQNLLGEAPLSKTLSWLVALMVALMALALLFAVAVHQRAVFLHGQLADRLTVQIIEADPASRDRQKDTAVAILQTLPSVKSVHALSQQELEKLVEPWLGPDAESEITLPALVDFTILPHGNRQLIAEKIHRVAPSASLDDHGSSGAALLAFLDLVTGLLWGVIFSIAIATIAIIALAVRSAVNSCQDKIILLSLLGAERSRIAGLFRYKTGYAVLKGSIVGSGIAVLSAILCIRLLVALPTPILHSDNINFLPLFFIAFLPMVAVIIGVMTAHIIVLRMVEKK